MKMFKKSLALLFALLLCCTTLCSIFSVYAEDVEYGDNDIPCWDPEEEEETKYKGDANKDGVVDALDYAEVKKFAFELVSEETFLDNCDFEASDIDDNDVVDSVDAANLKKFVFEMISPDDAKDMGFPV